MQNCSGGGGAADLLAEYMRHVTVIETIRVNISPESFLFRMTGEDIEKYTEFDMNAVFASSGHIKTRKTL
jgi:hypothetical protein